MLTGLAAVTTRTYPWWQVYSTNDYLRLLNTYSDHRLLAEDQRSGLFAGLADLIDHFPRAEVVVEAAA